MNEKYTFVLLNSRRFLKLFNCYNVTEPIVTEPPENIANALGNREVRWKCELLLFPRMVFSSLLSRDAAQAIHSAAYSTCFWPHLTKQVISFSERNFCIYRIIIITMAVIETAEGAATIYKIPTV